MGILFGMAPGIHPNMIVLLVPLLISLGSPPAAIVMIVAMAITNIIVDYIPSILLGAPDPESALAVLPGHRMLMAGEGYLAIKLAVLGSLAAIMVCMALLPLIIILVPMAYTAAQPGIPIILIGFVLIMVWSSKKKILSLLCFLLAGIIGLLSSGLPISNILILFPIFTGFFAFPCLLLQIKTKINLPKQSIDSSVEKKKLVKPALLGSVGGIASGLLPGVGSSEIAGLATVDKNNHSFLVTLGAIAAANTLLSFLALWLIGNPRSGVAVAVSQFTDVGLGEFILITIAALISAAIAVIITLYLARKSLKLIEKIDYSLVSRVIVIMLCILVVYFTGIAGLLLATLCCALGMVVNLSGIKRGLLMGVLILPTILFYMGI
ncbi:MAG: tripartite tricarboxylate transporter permease [Candidatus Aenigmarchaeota archaeon]|nr:tripartite tricarboxylate transporter permease [Candidatus Aenigmarchaeota archaeon]